MTTSQPSGSEPGSSFDRLHPEIRRWIWEQRWSELRDVQNRSIQAVLDGAGDVLIAAATAAGKTEAAFLPILTRIADRRAAGLSVLYVSPLKALINDQFRRIELLCERLDVNVVRWHGDAPQSAKAKVAKQPSGIALITPESIEALFVRRPGVARTLFDSLDFIVIDELHAFLQGPRGLHLAVLLNRIDELAHSRARRVGLSATLGDLALAARWLDSDRTDDVIRIESSVDAPELRLQIKGYVDPSKPAAAEDHEAEDSRRPALDRIAGHLFTALRGSNNLVFAGSRGRVEEVADTLRRQSERVGVPNEFFPHHGNLSRDLREALEERLKRAELPTTAVATTTLELGIDIGSVTSVAQIGAPRSLASLRQRLGRSGRRKGVPAVLRIYAWEKQVAADSDPLERLRLDVVRSIAAVRLLLLRFVEPPGRDPSLATVVLHQTLSIIAERGGERAERLYRSVCGAGPLRVFEQADYVELLRGMASPESRLIEQARDGTIMLGEEGEALTQARDFYAIFQTDEEWRLVSAGRVLGTIPIINAVGVGSMVIFAGRRWRVATVDDRGKVLDVVAHATARIPMFDNSSGEPLHDRLVAEMMFVYQDTDQPSYLDQAAADLLAEGRAAFRDLALGTTRLVPFGRSTHVLLWRGTAMNSVFAIALAAAGLKAAAHDLGVIVADATPDEVASALRQIATGQPPPSAAGLAQFVGNLRIGKFDDHVPETLLRRLWGRANEQVVQEITAVARRISGG
jgi:ATP-dependent Lhr-like helicase